MDTFVSIEVVGHGSRDHVPAEVSAAVSRALNWFGRVERVCSRFDPTSELRRLSTTCGQPTVVSDLVFEAVQFALAVAAETDGAFDPTVGIAMESLGFDRHYRTGERVDSALERDPATDDAGRVSFRDVHLDPVARTITLRRPLVLDLGAVAKGLAIDLAARDLDAFQDFAIDAGGDLYLSGTNADGEPWRVGIRDPRDPERTVATVRVSNRAVCTSGDYERRRADHHILDPRTNASARAAVSATVIAPTAMVADALATAAFVLGPDAGLELLYRHGVDGFIVSSDLTTRATTGLQL